jgi:adenosylcobinamide kinase / adenosylcobinamide-phosphate guanylyltransferase
MSAHCLILGGARSGKSRMAEDLGRAWSGPRIYLASGEAGDEEMQDRIALHRQGRGDSWVTVEEPVAVLERLRVLSDAGTFILFDCVTLWLSNLIHRSLDVRTAVDELADALPGLPGRIVIVSNEVGLGIVPDNALARHFRDEAGRANQKLAEACGEVIFVAAGLPVKLKG